MNVAATQNRNFTRNFTAKLMHLEKVASIA